MLLWLCVICPPTVLYCPLKAKPPVFCTLMEIDSAVMAAALFTLIPSSSKYGPFELITGVTVTPPVPVVAGFTVRVTVVECCSVPLVPVTVTLAAPVAAVPDAAKVSLLAPVVDAGLNVAVTPAGKPLALNATLPLKPPAGVTVTPSVPELPWLMETPADVAVREKSGLTGTVTVTLICVAAESVPLEPLIVTVAVPAVAVVDAENVTVLEPVVDAGLKEAETPAGNPLALNATLPLKPPEGVTVMLSVPELP